MDRATQPHRPEDSPGGSRRRFLTGAGAAAGALALGSSLTPLGAARDAPAAAGEGEVYRVKNGQVRQSVVHWCFQPMSVETLARHAARMGIQSVELVAPEHWPMLRSLGLTCAIASSHGFSKGFAHREEHAECVATLRESIDASAAFGIPSVITFSGFRRGLETAEAIGNMVDGLKEIVGHAEKKKVTLCLEMLNSKVDETMKGHPDYMCDKIEYALEVCRRIGSERMKILFDIYHVQIMEGDVIRRIEACKEFIGHYHTAGNPGRGELDDTQEIHYPGILKAIVRTGYPGFVGQEFIPTRDPVSGLSEAVRLCDV